MKILAIIVTAMITQGVFASGIGIDPATGIDMGNTNITNLSEPELASDAATKAYVDGFLNTTPAPVPKTGQTLCYDDTVHGAEIPCLGTGQDGDLEQGVTWPNPRFTDNSDGTVTDNLTGLVWLEKANCKFFFLGDIINQNDRTWKEALTATNSLSNGSCGLSDGSSAGDWHLPNSRELFSLIDNSYIYPALSNAAGTGQWTEDDAFSGVLPDNYWTSTSRLTVTNYAILILFGHGSMGGTNKLHNGYVWPVKAR